MPSGPKSNKFTNRHADEARKRDEERLNSKKAAQAAAKEDAKWAETDAKALKKQGKQREDDMKAAEKATREAEKRLQLADEERELSAKAPKKVAQRQAQKDVATRLAAYDKEQAAIRGTVAEQEELPSGNLNRQRGVQGLDDPSSSAAISASGTAGEVLRALEKGGMAGAQSQKASDGVPEDRHIGKRARVMYRSYYAEHLPKVREAKPGMRRTQYHDVIWEMWCKDPANPFVQRSELRDRVRLEEERRWVQGGDSDEEDEEAEGA